MKLLIIQTWVVKRGKLSWWLPEFWLEWEVQWLLLRWGSLVLELQGWGSAEKQELSFRCVKCELTAEAPSGDPKEVNMTHTLVLKLKLWCWGERVQVGDEKWGAVNSGWDHWSRAGPWRNMAFRAWVQEARQAGWDRKDTGEAGSMSENGALLPGWGWGGPPGPVFWEYWEGCFYWRRLLRHTCNLPCLLGWGVSCQWRLEPE